MSDSWRITTREVDNSNFVSPDINVTGAFVIKASKGTEKPIKISTREEKRIIDIFGYPSEIYPGVWEAIQMNQEAPIWLSAPFASDAKYGGVLVTKAGSKPFVIGLDDPANLNLAQIDYEQTIGVGDGIETNFTDILELLPYVNQSIDITVNGVSLNIIATDVDTEILSGDAPFDAGTLVRSTGSLDITFLTAPAEGDIIKAVFQSNQSEEVYFTLFDTSPNSLNDKGVLVTRNANTGYFLINVYLKDNRNRWRVAASYEVALEPDTLNGFGENIYIEEVFNNNDYLIAIDNTLVYSTFTNDITRINLGGGSRGSAITATELQVGWDYFKQKRAYPADIFVDTTADPAIPDIFNTLRTSYQKYKDYLLPLPINNDVSTAISTKSGYSINNRGLAFYWNWGRVRNTYNNSSFWTTLLGRVALRFVAMRDIYNGLAPAWVNENNHGGQLGSGILEMKYDPSEDDLELLDSSGINPIIFDSGYGVMVVSHKTAQSPDNLTDASFISHSRCFDYVINNIQPILTQQLTKLNDTIHRERVRALAQNILDPIVASSVFTGAVAKCDAENNNTVVLSQRKFILDVHIVVTPTSEEIIFSIINHPQGVDVQEFV